MGVVTLQVRVPMVLAEWLRVRAAVGYETVSACVRRQLMEWMEAEMSSMDAREMVAKRRASRLGEGTPREPGV